ncbi:DUF6090 family protein [Litoribaculum gwangyangense]|uniref:Uncharacterized protein n=1 Tax=Litoribaculum gwangyangense TaxID=1130722 RepID=A0ABP9CBX6_9FLAO
MIKFFRRIRQRLLSENKFSKYLIYAIGETILVVIGILIALSINNWNEDKKARIYEEKMLTEIRNVLIKDVYFFENHLIGRRIARIQRASQFFENYILTDSISRDSINYHYIGLSTGLQVTYNRGPFEALKSTGIDRIINDSLRNMIVDLYEFELPRTAGLIKIYMDEYMTNAKKYEDSLRDDMQIDIQNKQVFYYYNKMKEVDLKTNQSFLSLLSWGSNSSKQILHLFNSILPKMKALTVQIDKELNHHKK